jgi:hypothetical protein
MHETGLGGVRQVSGLEAFAAGREWMVFPL